MRKENMRATKTSRTRTNQRAGARKQARSARLRRALKPVAKAVTRPMAAPPVQVLYRICKPGWAVIVEKAPHANGTRFLCPFCPLSHRVPGPVRGFRKMRKAPWIRLRRVEE
jgi:hypothetical protein